MISWNPGTKIASQDFLGDLGSRFPGSKKFKKIRAWEPRTKIPQKVLGSNLGSGSWGLQNFFKINFLIFWNPGTNKTFWGNLVFGSQAPKNSNIDFSFFGSLGTQNQDPPESLGEQLISYLLEAENPETRYPRKSAQSNQQFPYEASGRTKPLPLRME